MPKRSHTLTALALAGAALAAPAGAAASDTIRLTHYDLTFEARIDHQHVVDFRAGDLSYHGKLDDTTKLFGQMPVTFADGRVQPTAQGKTRAFTTAEYKASQTDIDFSGSSQCTANPGLPVEWGGPSISEPLLTPLGDPEIHLRLSESSKAAWDSCSGNAGVIPFPELGDPSKELGEGPLDAVFTMPTEAIGNGKIIQLISGPPTGSGGFCPGKDDPTTLTCTYGWSGTVTLTKTGETVISDGDGSPAPHGSGGAPGKGSGARPSGTAPSKAKKPGASASTKASADAKGKTVSFDADCPLGCAGTAHLNFGGGAAKASAAKGVALRFTVKPGARRKVTLKVPASARAKLRAARRPSLRLTLTPKGGRPVSRTLAVRVARKR